MATILLATLTVGADLVPSLKLSRFRIRCHRRLCRYKLKALTILSKEEPIIYTQTRVNRDIGTRRMIWKCQDERSLGVRVM